MEITLNLAQESSDETYEVGPWDCATDTYTVNLPVMEMKGH